MRKRNCTCTVLDVSTRQGEVTRKWRAVCVHGYVGQARCNATEALNAWDFTAVNHARAA